MRQHHEQYMNEDRKRDVQRRLCLFKRLPVICGLGFIPLIVISLLIMEAFGLPIAVFIFSACVAFLVGLAMGAINMRRRMMSGATVPTQRKSESTAGPRLRALVYILIILIVPFVLILFSGEFWIGIVGLFLIAIALRVVRFYMMWRKRKGWKGIED